MGFVFLTQQSQSFLLPFVYRSICWPIFFKIGVLFPMKFHKIHRKLSVLEYNFSKVTGLICCNFAKKRLQHRFFLWNLLNFWEHLFFTEHLQWLLQRLSGRLVLCELNWYVETLALVFSCEFCEIFKNIIDHFRWLLLSVTRCKTKKYTMKATCNGLIVCW